MDSELLKLKSEKALLKKQVRLEREEKKQLKEQILSLESELGKKDQEIEAFQLSNLQLFKKCESLQEEQKERQQSGWGWGFFKSSSSYKLEDLETNLELLKEELHRKIEENESVHGKNYHLKEKYRLKKQECKESAQSREQLSRESSAQIDELSIQLATHRQHIQQLMREIDQLKRALQQKAQELVQSQQEFLRKQDQMASKTQGLEWKLRQKVSLDDAGYEECYQFDASTFHPYVFTKQHESIAKSLDSGQSLYTEISAFLRNYLKRLEYLYEQSSPSYKFIIDRASQIVHSLPESVDLEVFDKMRFVKMLRYALSVFSRLFSMLKVQLDGEVEWVDSISEVSNANNDLLETFYTIEFDLKRLMSLSYSSAFCKHSAWENMQSVLKRLVANISECSKAWGKRLALDTSLNYTAAARSSRTVNDELLLNLEKICWHSSYIYSLLAQVKSDFYYNTSLLYKHSETYLNELRIQEHKPGVAYETALSNVIEVKSLQSEVTQQVNKCQEMQELMEQAKEDSEKARGDVIRLQNEVAAIELNLGSRDTENSSSQLFEDSECLSEDVKNGVQRIALRLCDREGQGVPVSSLGISSDVRQRIQELALDKINSLAQRLGERYILEEV